MSKDSSKKRQRQSPEDDELPPASPPVQALPVSQRPIRAATVMSVNPADPPSAKRHRPAVAGSPVSAAGTKFKCPICVDHAGCKSRVYILNQLWT